MAAKFRKYIQSPVLTNISVTYDDFEAFQVEPRSFPDLLAERPIVIFGKWRGDCQWFRTGNGCAAGAMYPVLSILSLAQKG